MHPTVRANALALLFVAALFVPAAARGQTLTSGLLAGTVRDASGRAVSGATVTLRDRASGGSRSFRASQNGRFAIPFLAPGEYDVTVERLGSAPSRVEAVPVRAGRRQVLEVVLGSLQAEAGAPEVARFGGGPPAAGEWRLSGWDRFPLPEDRRDLSGIATLSTFTGPGLEVEGLPASLGGVFVDGILVSGARHPMLATGGPPPFGLSAFADGEILAATADVEWSGTAAAPLGLYTRRGTSRMEVRTFGSWSTGASGADGAGSYQGLHGGALVSGPLAGDSAGFAVGVESWRVDTPVQLAAGMDSLAVRLSGVARDVFGAGDAFAPAREARSDVVSAFARVNGRLGASHLVSVRANLATLPASSPLLAASGRPGFSTSFDGMDLSAGATLTSRLGRSVFQELSVGVERSTRDYGGRDALGTLFVGGGLAVGHDPGLAGRFQQTVLRGREAVHFLAGEHRVKLGVSADFGSYDHTYRDGRTGEFLFSGSGEFALGQGYLVESGGASANASFSLPQFGAFLQDTWTVAPGLDLLAGVRYDAERLPTGDAAPDSAWLRRSGLQSDSVKSRRGAISPRAGFEWNVGQRNRVLLYGAGGLFRGRWDPNVLSELLANDGRVTVRRGFGTFGGWPGLAAASAGLEPTLTLGAPGIRPPSTARGVVGGSFAVAPGAALHLAALYRRTEDLPRRTDLNLLASPLFADQYGRPVFGVLQQQGAILAAEAGSNRRFGEYDVVTAIGVDGWSEHRSLTAGFDLGVGDHVTLLGSYTYSSTEDNWLMARDRADAQLPPFPGEDGERWSEGTSDFDVPHRALAGAEIAFPALRGSRLAALYRYRSGYPFTPGFRAGVDANGDGSFRNDPAFVDAAVAGFDAVADAWPCLREQVGAFARRNSCRAEGVHSLDLRLGLGFLRSQRYAAEIIVDGLDLLASEAGEPDRALYLLDESRALALDRAAGRVAVPLVANPAFGSTVLRTSPGRVLRLGIQVSH